jgi:hypothetical protein
VDAYQQANGHYPKELQDLVPTYTPKLPALDVDYDYKVHGEYYLIFFPHRGELWNVYWSKDKKWRENDFTDWPEE